MAQQDKNMHKDLIEKCRAGDRKAQFEIYKFYYKAMYNTSLRITNNPTVAEDLMQESFLKAFQNIGQFGEKSSFGAWLKRIVINNSIDHLRENSPNVNSIEEEVHADVPDTMEEDHHEVLSFKIDRIRKIIEELPENYRVVVSLHLLEGYDHQEIADVLGISYDNARARYSRAKKAILKNFTELKKRN